ncbi:SIS domain-containing protein [Conexibacter arvalis]|uniref:Glucosamine--fructose-6-phosphate aminotransferase (Isomerizing) n=1 Tax=Conexibacter arvalis TaxID=912552 RepID=A0A840I9K6_9ACTN|nr:SIS domain-containing protein [Conexibacter arvalis]MBB4661546.1 glucosamine--fructose-6-phosphate aminotransferase (isomerizing) [Conexibacter arvalis]
MSARRSASASGAELLLDEIREQPAAWRRLLEREEEIAELGGRLAAADPVLVRIAAHGTSDHAAAYAMYALRLLCGWTAMRDSMSLPLSYGAAAAAPGELAIGLSQSGETPDVVAWLEAARAAGATAVAVTNADEGSSLARAADGVVSLSAGPERSIAATKTYTCTLAALALLGAHAAGGERGTALAASLRETADLAESALPALEAAVLPVADVLAGTERLYSIARGLELATAAEVALKLTEVAYLCAKALTATSMAHGPVAALDRAFPVWAVAADDDTLAGVREAVRRARDAGAPVIATGPAAAALEGAAFTLPTPAAPDPLLSPLLSVLPGQLFARALALAKGIDPGAPRHLRKVTLAA